MKKYIKPSMRVKAIYEKNALMDTEDEYQLFAASGLGTNDAKVNVRNDIELDTPDAVGAKPHSVWDPEDLDEE